MSNNCPNCGSESTTFTDSINDRRGGSNSQVLKGLCADCGVRIHKDVESGDSVAYGGELDKTEGEAIIELRKAAGAPPTNFIHYCPVCDDSWQENIDHEHELAIWPNPDHHPDKEVTAYCTHQRTEDADDADLLDSEEIVSSERVEYDDGGEMAYKEVVTIECNPDFESPEEAAQHAHETGHDVSFKVQ